MTIIPKVTTAAPTSTLVDTPGNSLLPSQPPTLPTSSPHPIISTPSPTVIPTDPTPEATSAVRVPARYDLNAVFDFTLHSLSVIENITYRNLSSDSLPDLTLIIEPNLIPGGFTLLSMTWSDGTDIGTYDLSENQMVIPLPQPLPPGEPLEIEINYQLEIPEILDLTLSNRPIAYGYTSRQTNIVDWYPYVPPYRDGAGWLVHRPWGLGEYQVFDVADFNVTITLAEPVQQLVMAASAPAMQAGDRYTYHLETARSFALSASIDYLLQTMTVDNVTIYSYSFPYDKYASLEVLQNTADALQLYSRLIVPYSRSSLSIVEADFLDGMEYDGLFFLSHGFYDLYDGTPKGYLTFIAAHETAHQWWYGLVANDQALEPWLDEALCTYMELVYYENIYSDYPPHSGGSLNDWWWYYRVNFYNPEGWVNSPIYDFTQFRSYRDSVYLVGAKFMDDLRHLIGDEAFFAFLRDYAHQKAYSIATSQDFFDILRIHTTQDLDPLLSTYFQPVR